MAGGIRDIKIRFTGDTKGLSAAAKKAERAVDGFSKNVRKSVSKTAAGIPDIFSKVLGSLPPMGHLIAGALAAGLAVTLAPALGAAISAAVLLGLGGGVLALGIAAAVKNPQVTAAFDGLKKKAKSVVAEFGAPFIGPLVRAAGTFGKLLDDLRPQIAHLGRIMAPVIDRLAPAFAQFLKNAMPGITKAVEAAVPLFNILAAKLPGVGRAISTFFTEISKNGDDTNQFFSDLIDLISGTIIVLGKTISKLASWYSNVRNFLSKVQDGFREMRVRVINEFGRILDGAAAAFSWVPGVGPKLKKAQQEFSKFRAEANRELAAIKDKRVRVEAYSNVGKVASAVASTLRAIRDERVFISIGSNIGSVVGNIARQIGNIAGKRAGGGPVSAGRSYLVGERGPEIVTMGGNGNVTPNHELGGPSVLELTVNLGRGIQEIISINLRDHDRNLKGQLAAGVGRN